VLDWLAEQRVTLVRLNWKGDVVSVLVLRRSSEGALASRDPRRSDAANAIRDEADQRQDRQLSRDA
jgi:hypothetical protein